MSMLQKINKGLFIMTCAGLSMNAFAEDYQSMNAEVLKLAQLTDAPTYIAAEGFDSSKNLKAIYFDALSYEGKETKVFAWLGLPEKTSGKVPGVVLVHGGGGTAFKEWVKRWNDRGYAAISIAVEGQTDIKPSAEERAAGNFGKPHPWPGPKRVGIYGDSNKPLEEQWMYHAVAQTILANSLLRSLPEVDAEKVGLMGISWGGVITSTVMGLDDRLAFAIPTYGCGGLSEAGNQYGRSLGNNEVYKQVWDPMLRMDQAKMPSLWFSWPEDKHFPLDCQASSYRKTTGTHSICLVPEMGHGHGPPWNRPESYAFADSVLKDGAPWCRQTAVKEAEGSAQVIFTSTKKNESGTLVSTTDSGVTGERTWVKTPAELTQKGTKWLVKAVLPPDTTAWFMNVHSDGLITSSEFQDVQN